jgi:hypothetical protein
MLYLVPTTIVAGLGFMFWMVAFRLRPDRVAFAREYARAVFRLRPTNLIRYLLGRSFAVPSETPEWQDRLVSRLRRVPEGGGAARGPADEKAS